MKKYKIEIRWAFIFAVMYLLWMIMEKLTGLHDKYLNKQQVVSMLILIPSIAIYVLALKKKKSNFYSGHIMYKQSFISGLALTIFIVLLSPVNQLIVSYIISPSYFSNVIEYTVNSGVFTREQAETQFSITNYIVTSIVAGLITGIIFSAIISIFIKSKPNNHEQK